MKSMTRERRRIRSLLEFKNAYEQAELTLDGERAKITGFMLDFPFISSLESSKKIEISRDALARVINQEDGKFHTQ